MSVQRFVKWCETATTRERADGVALLASAVIEGRVPEAEIAGALAGLTMILDDPSPKVRRAMAEVLARSEHAPISLVRALGEDVEEIACLVAGLSPVLSDVDLIDLAAIGNTPLQVAIAGRARVSVRLAAALAEIGGRMACLRLLENEAADIAASSHRRIAERHGGDAGVRGLQLQRADLPPDVHQILILEIGQALAGSFLVRQTLGPSRAQSLVAQCCEKGTAAMAERVTPAGMPVLIEHLRHSGQLSTAFLVRIVCAGNVDLFAAALVSLSGLSERRVRAIVVDGREAAFGALLARCGLPASAATLLRAAIQAWKQAITAEVMPDADVVAAEVMQRLVALHHARRDDVGAEALNALLRRLEYETTLQRARHYAEQALAA